jgi:hypothetical protein
VLAQRLHSEDDVAHHQALDELHVRHLLARPFRNKTSSSASTTRTRGLSVTLATLRQAMGDVAALRARFEPSPSPGRSVTAKPAPNAWAGEGRRRGMGPPGPRHPRDSGASPTTDALAPLRVPDRAPQPAPATSRDHVDIPSVGRR